MTCVLGATLTLSTTTTTITNAAGGINLSYKPGDLVLISDHINLQGANPLMGPNDDSLGPRFPDMSEVYSRKYGGIAKEVAAELGDSLGQAIAGGLAWLLRERLQTAQVPNVEVLQGDGRQLHLRLSGAVLAGEHQAVVHAARTVAGVARDARPVDVRRRCREPGRNRRGRRCGEA